MKRQVTRDRRGDLRDSLAREKKNAIRRARLFRDHFFFPLSLEFHSRRSISTSSALRGQFVVRIDEKRTRDREENGEKIITRTNVRSEKLANDLLAFSSFVSFIVSSWLYVRGRCCSLEQCIFPGTVRCVRQVHDCSRANFVSKSLRGSQLDATVSQTRSLFVLSEPDGIWDTDLAWFRSPAG